MLREPQSDPHCGIAGIAQPVEFALKGRTVAMLAVPQEFPGPMEATASAPSSGPLPFEQLGTWSLAVQRGGRIRPLMCLFQ